MQGVVFIRGRQPGAVTVDNPAATTILCDVAFTGQQGHGVAQAGGVLIADNVIFESIGRDPAADGQDRLSGTALVLRAGVLASLREVEVHGTDGSALHAQDSGTEVTLTYLPRSIPPEAAAITGSLGCLGAVAVRNGAYLQGSRVTLDENHVMGAAVDGPGSRAEFQFLQVTATRKLQQGDVTFALCGNETVASVAASSGAGLRISGSADEPFLLSGSDLVGVLIRGTEGAPLVELSNGTVSSNPIGVAVIGSCDVLESQKLEDNVAYVDNQVNLDANCLPVPVPSIETNCHDGIDNDEDGLIDAEDPDCTSDSVALRPSGSPMVPVATRTGLYTRYTRRSDRDRATD
jgi:hypothetical protein